MGNKPIYIVVRWGGGCFTLASSASIPVRTTVPPPQSYKTSIWRQNQTLAIAEEFHMTHLPTWFLLHQVAFDRPVDAIFMLVQIFHFCILPVSLTVPNLSQLKEVTAVNSFGVQSMRFGTLREGEIQGGDWNKRRFWKKSKPEKRAERRDRDICAHRRKDITVEFSLPKL